MNQLTLKGFRPPISTIKIRIRFSAHADWKSATRQTGSLRYGFPSAPGCVYGAGRRYALLAQSIRQGYDWRRSLTNGHTGSIEHSVIASQSRPQARGQRYQRKVSSISSVSPDIGGLRDPATGRIDLQSARLTPS